MLYIIGLGLWDENSMSLEALQAGKDCDQLFSEFYTSNLFGTTFEKLEKTFGKKIIHLEREGVEQTDQILEAAKSKKVGFLVAGDALTATTHYDFLLEAKKAGIKTRIIHGSSIYTAAAGLSGLQVYKFGRATSLTFPQPGFEPESPYTVLKDNNNAGMHTLFFLDLQKDEQSGEMKYMTINEGLEVLQKIETKKGDGLVTDDTQVIAICRAGSKQPLIKSGAVKDLLEFDFGGPMHILIIPGKLHFKEEEALQAWK